MLFIAIKEISKTVGLIHENVKGFPIKKKSYAFQLPGFPVLGCFHCLAIVKKVVTSMTEQIFVEWVVKSSGSTTIVNPYRKGNM